MAPDVDDPMPRVPGVRPNAVVGRMRVESAPTMTATTTCHWITLLFSVSGDSDGDVP